MFRHKKLLTAKKLMIISIQEFKQGTKTAMDAMTVQHMVTKKATMDAKMTMDHMITNIKLNNSIYFFFKYFFSTIIIKHEIKI
jgi:hypothetical protein